MPLIPLYPNPGNIEPVSEVRDIPVQEAGTVLLSP